MAEISPAPDDFLLIGTIVAPFGVRGQVKVRSYTDHVDHLRRRIRAVYVGDDRKEYPLQRVLEHKPGLLVLTLGGLGTRDAAEELRGADVAILERDAAPLSEGEYFVHQLYDLLVVTDEGEELGRVREVLTTGANDVLVVARPESGEVLIPVIRDVVRELDIPGGRIVIHVITGLLPD